MRKMKKVHTISTIDETISTLEYIIQDLKELGETSEYIYQASTEQIITTIESTITNLIKMKNKL